MGIRDLFRKQQSGEEEYIELDLSQEGPGGGKAMIAVEKLESYADSDKVQRKLREGNIVLVRIKELKDKDIGELKRAISRIRKTCMAVNGDIAAISNEWVIVTPEFARVHRESLPAKHQSEDEGFGNIRGTDQV